MWTLASVQCSSTCEFGEAIANLIEFTRIRDVAVPVRKIFEHVLRSTNTIVSHRMRHEGAGNKVVGLLLFPLELLEKIHEGSGIISRSILILHAQQVRFAFRVGAVLWEGKRPSKAG